MDLVQQLESLKKERIETMPFSSLVEFEQWADAVLPLLMFSQSHYAKFDNAVDRGKMTYKMHSETDAATNMNEAIGILNQAISIAKAQSNNKKKPEADLKLEMPAKITISWLLNHVDFKHWVLLLTIFAAVFSAGIWIGQSEIYKLITKESTYTNNASVTIK